MVDRRKFCVSHIHPAETFPLVVSVGIVIQGLVFAASQGTGLQSSLVTGCSVTAQFMLPGKYQPSQSTSTSNNFSTLFSAIHSSRLWS